MVLQSISWLHSRELPWLSSTSRQQIKNAFSEAELLDLTPVPLSLISYLNGKQWRPRSDCSWSGSTLFAHTRLSETLGSSWYLYSSWPAVSRISSRHVSPSITTCFLYESSVKITKYAFRATNRNKLNGIFLRLLLNLQCCEYLVCYTIYHHLFSERVLCKNNRKCIYGRDFEM